MSSEHGPDKGSYELNLALWTRSAQKDFFLFFSPPFFSFLAKRPLSVAIVVIGCCCLVSVVLFYVLCVSYNLQIYFFYMHSNFGHWWFISCFIHNELLSEPVIVRWLLQYWALFPALFLAEAYVTHMRGILKWYFRMDFHLIKGKGP